MDFARTGQRRPRHGRRYALAATAALVALGSITAVADAAPTTHQDAGSLPAASRQIAKGSPDPALRPLGGGHGTVRYATLQPVCGSRVRVGYANCLAMRRVDVPRGTPNSAAYVEPAVRNRGPAGGYTPGDLAYVYRYNPIKNVHQKVAIVDAYDDPNALRDLNTFDKHYGFPLETSRSFHKLNQRGVAHDYPHFNAYWALEISLDIEAVRAVCRKCRIVLIEADSSRQDKLSAAVNTAARLGANEISNSYAGPEFHAGRFGGSYHHPGVVMVAGTGDHGWYGWDFANSARPKSQNAASFPATSPYVVAAGGTTLGIGPQGRRTQETVWNRNGREDNRVPANGGAMGATGGGCSRVFQAGPWQKHHRGYGTAGCGGHRLDADLAAIGDPYTGFDIYDSFKSHGWQTLGGTSLATPVISAMYALAGGSHGALNPVATPYVNAGRFGRGAARDVINYRRFPGGNGYCGGNNATRCGNDIYRVSNHKTHNPNSLGYGLIDCSFPRGGKANAKRTSKECNATKGYDGPSGVGAPYSLRLFGRTNPFLRVIHPKKVDVGRIKKYAMRARPSILKDHITGYLWHWGDGTSTKRSSRIAYHRFHKPGLYHVTALVGDSRYQATIARFTVRVKRR